MKIINNYPDINWDAWFWLDKEEFPGEWKEGQCRYRVEKAVGRDEKGVLFLMVWENHDKYNWRKFTQTFYEIDENEYLGLLDRAIAQGEVAVDERNDYIEKEKEPFHAPWDIHKDVVVYKDGLYELGQKNSLPYFTVDGKTYGLGCHPYEPCTYLKDGEQIVTAIHNAFDPFDVLEAFFEGRTVTSITGFEYDAKDFCDMLDYATGFFDAQIDEAEKVFRGRQKKKNPQKPEEKGEEKGEKKPSKDIPQNVLESRVIEKDPFYDLLERYPDSVVDFRIVKNEDDRGYNAHWMALLWGCRSIFCADEEEDSWHFDVAKADGRQISVSELFAPESPDGKLNYRKAFLSPPYGRVYSDEDFDRINAALFPHGADGLEVYEWTTDWSDYFDEGHEWWGALCLTVYDKSLDRFAVILASATD